MLDCNTVFHNLVEYALFYLTLNMSTFTNREKTPASAAAGIVIVVTMSRRHGVLLMGACAMLPEGHRCDGR